MPGQFVKDVNAPEFVTEVVQRSHDVPVVVDFWAEWCGPCRTLGPLLERLAEEYNGGFELVKVDVDANQALAQQFGIQSIPSVIAFKGGVPVNQFAGALPEQAVRSFLESVVPSTLDLATERARDAMLEGDDAVAEEQLRGVLSEKMDHEEAGTTLASLYLSQGRNAEALDALAPLSPTAEVEKLRATARVTQTQGEALSEVEKRLAADPGDDQARLDLAAALASNAEYEAALDHFLEVVRKKSGLANDARQGMIDIFELLGADHPLSLTYRKHLANALF